MRPFTEVLANALRLEHSIGSVELVLARALTPAEERKLREQILRAVEHPFRVTRAHLESIPRAASGKYQNLRSEVAGPREDAAFSSDDRGANAA